MKKKHDCNINGFRHAQIVWRFVWLLDILDGECVEKQYVLKVPPSTEPESLFSFSKL